MGERDRGSQRDKDKKRDRNGRENDTKRDKSGRVTERKDR